MCVFTGECIWIWSGPKWKLETLLGRAQKQKPSNWGAWWKRRVQTHSEVGREGKNFFLSWPLTITPRSHCIRLSDDGSMGAFLRIHVFSRVALQRQQYIYVYLHVSSKFT